MGAILRIASSEMTDYPTTTFCRIGIDAVWMNIEWRFVRLLQRRCCYEKEHSLQNQTTSVGTWNHLVQVMQTDGKIANNTLIPSMQALY
jgi:hypothetical protein